jgi:prepilin-type processing-associated H-X9-DG protein
MDKISYINPNAHVTGSNYLFADGHGAKYSLADTLNPNAYLWGTHVWSCADQPEVQQNTGQ